MICSTACADTVGAPLDVPGDPAARIVKSTQALDTTEER